MRIKDVYTVKDFDFTIFENVQVQKKRKGQRGKTRYYDIVLAFDIETTNIDEIRNSVMYIWQLQVGKVGSITGRTWDEFRECLDMIEAHSSTGDALYVTLVHNLSFEWQWLKNVIKIDDVFAMDDRKVLYFTSSMFEFRCTYIHSNMSLDKYVESVGGEYRKVKNYDYSKKRYYFTPLTDEELEYCIMDVRSLEEAYTLQMERDGDNLYSIPYTSTGYVRREFKRALHKHRFEIKEALPDAEVFEGLRQAFRGGNTHANRWNADKILDNVTSYDISSSYPSVMLTELFPMEFVKREPAKFEQALRFNRACLIHIELFDVMLIDERFGAPYLPKAKLETVTEAVLDNGRVLSCEYCRLWLTEIDFTILLKEYEFSYNILELYTAKKKPLPKAFRELLLSMYVKKTEMKGGDEYAYNKYKNMVNAT